MRFSFCIQTQWGFSTENTVHRPALTECKHDTQINKAMEKDKINLFNAVDDLTHQMNNKY